MERTKSKTLLLTTIKINKPQHLLFAVCGKIWCENRFKRSKPYVHRTQCGAIRIKKGLSFFHHTRYIYPYMFQLNYEFWIWIGIPSEKETIKILCLVNIR